jgi:diacylglycerol kinase (ATP)
MNHYEFFVNPVAGRGKALAVWRQVEQKLLAAQKRIPFTYRVNMSNPRLATDSLPEHSILVALGGDGTVHQVGQIAVERQLRMGIIPAGTGNDFANNLGIPSDLAQCVDNLFSLCEQGVDVLRVNGEVTLNACGFGIDAEVVEFIESHASLKKVGKLSYAVAVPVVLMRHRPYSVELSIDGRRITYHGVSLIVLSNAPTFGGGMRVTPQANPTDGLMDVCVVSNLPKPTLIRLFPLIYSGRHVSHKSVTMYKGRRVSLDFLTNARRGELDGELTAPVQRVTADLEGGKLRLLCPSGMAQRL